MVSIRSFHCLPSYPFFLKLAPTLSSRSTYLYPPCLLTSLDTFHSEKMLSCSKDKHFLHNTRNRAYDQDMGYLWSFSSLQGVASNTAHSHCNHRMEVSSPGKFVPGNSRNQYRWGREKSMTHWSVSSSKFGELQDLWRPLFKSGGKANETGNWLQIQCTQVCMYPCVYTFLDRYMYTHT